VNPTLTANLAELDRLVDGLTELLRHLDSDAINWSPPFDGTNSIAAMTAHLVGATGRWLSHGAGNRRPGVREAEFRARSTPDESIALVARARADARSRFATLDGVDPGASRASFGVNDRTEDVSAAYCVEHALVHAFEHWGQIQLTRQLIP
jgi:uncharacterized damage-inducible protein DinB